MKFLLKICVFFLLVVSCSSYRGQNRVSKSDIRFKGGVYKDQSWDDSLIFKRTSFYKGANLTQDVLTAKLENDGKFSLWLGESKSLLSQCQNLYIVLIYSAITDNYSASGIKQQISKQGYKEYILPDFANNLKAHFNFQDWHLQRHRILGYCHESDFSGNGVSLVIPGFKETEILQ